MARGGRGGGRGRGRGGRGRGGHRGGKNKNWNDRGPARSEPWSDIPRNNDYFEAYYKGAGFLSDEEFEEMWKHMRSDLPNSFRFTGTKSDALAVREIFKQRYIPKITSVEFEGQPVQPPQAVHAFPDELVWDMKTHKKVVRRHPGFSEFQKFLVLETTAGNISRQEVVSMIPPHFLDVRPGMVVLDMCAAPGSKSAQLAEMIHGDEEERVKNAAAGNSSAVEGDYSDDGRSTGLLIANDTDYKRAGMLVHQVKRLNFPNLIVTQHDASIFPSIELPITPGEKKQYLKFDRILADVPCSGDGTARKNPNVWQKWTPRDALGLHNLQLRILNRGLSLLKKGGRLVYSTCSMNPVENEAVVAAAIEAAGGVSKVQLVDASGYLPNLKRKPGLEKWSVCDISYKENGSDKMVHVFSTLENFENTVKKYYDTDPGRTFSPKVTSSMFPPTAASEQERIPIERCVRVYPHLQDTGGFFIAVLEKKDDIKIAQPAPSTQPSTPAPNSEVKNVVSGDTIGELNGVGSSSPQKRKLEDVDEPNSTKRPKADANGAEAVVHDADTMEDIKNTSQAISKPEPTSNDQLKSKSGNPDRNQEQYEYLSPENETMKGIMDFYGISKRFPRDRFMVKNREGILANKIYYTSELAKIIITLNKDRGFRFVHCGVVMFVSHKIKSGDGLRSPWRLQNEGIKILQPWASKRIVTCKSKATLHLLLTEMFPKLPKNGEHGLGEVGQQLEGLEPGCCFLTIPKSEGEDGFPFDMVFALWRHPGSINLMVDKDDRKALLLRFYDEIDPVIKNHVTDKAKSADEVRDEAKEEAKEEVEEDGKEESDGDAEME